MYLRYFAIQRWKRELYFIIVYVSNYYLQKSWKFRVVKKEMFQHNFENITLEVFYLA